MNDSNETQNQTAQKDAPINFGSFDFNEDDEASSVFKEVSPTTPQQPSQKTEQQNESVNLVPIQKRQLIVETSVSPKIVEKARALAQKITLDNPEQSRSVSTQALKPIEDIARTLLSNVRVDEMDQLGRAASEILNGVKILRIDDLKNEISNTLPKPARFGFKRLLKVGSSLKTATQSFSENRKSFLDVVDRQVAKCEATIADAVVRKTLLIEQNKRLRQSVYDLTTAILAYQYAIDREIDAFELQRERVCENLDPVDIQNILFRRDRILAMERDAMALKVSFVKVADTIPTNSNIIKATEMIIEGMDRVARITIPSLINAAANVAQNAINQKGIDQIEKINDLDQLANTMASTGAALSVTNIQKAINIQDSCIKQLEDQSSNTIKSIESIFEAENAYRELRKTQEERLVAVRDNLISSAIQIRDKSLSHSLK